MKKILLFFTLLSFTCASCKKTNSNGPKEPGSATISDPIVLRYSGLIPEVNLFKNLKEELNSTEQYIVIAGSSENKILVAYVDKKSKQLAFKSIFNVLNEVKGNFLISEIKTSPAQLKNGAVSLILGRYSEGILIELGTLIIYPNSNGLKHIAIPYPEGLSKEPSNINFTFKTISFFWRDSLFLFDRNTTEKLLASMENGAHLMVHPLAKMFLEGNKMVWVEFLPNDKKNCVIKCFPLSEKNGQYTEIWSRIIPVIEAGNTDIVTHQFFLSDDENNIILRYKAFGKKESVSTGDLKDFSEETLYTFNKETGSGKV